MNKAQILIELIFSPSSLMRKIIRVKGVGGVLVFELRKIEMSVMIRESLNMWLYIVVTEIEVKNLDVSKKMLNVKQLTEATRTSRE